ncbi:MAG: sensor histidine kinase [Pseudomonas sp.]|uniref:sensor histidine kinase n=1 Tax=Pseudomonas sp. TaxID=306 RepID=UPI001E020FC3|nr:sensor histidine kinase [Pseudomonas sp.]MPS98059.1 sensor histidine kinase [Pseudomonas sp.]
MRLSQFLEAEREAIIKDAIAYARSIKALEVMSDESLRNHLPHLLQSIALDLRTPQTRQESIDKSHDLAPQQAEVTSAQSHGLLRARLGLSIEQLVAEYRALRSSILRLWMDKNPPDRSTLEDTTRFNEAIDQAVAESVQFFSQERERWREIFLGVLGHDLRGPLNSIHLTAEMMRRTASAPAEQTALISKAVKRATKLLDTLLAYNRARFGAAMELQCEWANLGRACAEELELLRAAHPGVEIKLFEAGDLNANVDPSRVREALANLVSNAVVHGERSMPIVVRVEAQESEVEVSVENAGHIPADEFEALFEPLRQRENLSRKSRPNNLGLGLFIARQIARAHGGDTVGTCVKGVVRFTVSLPRVVKRSP